MALLGLGRLLAFLHGLALGLKLLAFLVLPLDLGCGLYRLADPRHNGARRFRGAAARLCCRRGCSG